MMDQNQGFNDFNGHFQILKKDDTMIEYRLLDDHFYGPISCDRSAELCCLLTNEVPQSFELFSRTTS